MNIVIRRTMSGLDDAFSTFNWNETKEVYEVLKYDERDFTTKVSKGSSVYKLTQTNKHFIYSKIINVLDNSGSTGFVCFSVVSRDKNEILYNFQNFLDHIETKYNESKIPVISDKNYFQDLYSLAKKRDLISFFIPHIEEVSVIVKANFNENFVDNYIYTLCNREVYFFDEKMNYDFGYITKEFNKIDYQFIISKYRFVTISLEEEASNVYIHINGNINTICNNPNKYKFLLNKDVQLAYSYINDNKKQIFPINGNEVIIQKNIVHKPIVNKSEEELYSLRKDIENLKYNNISLNKELKTYKILSAVLGALLLITIIGGGYYWFYYVKDSNVTSNTETSETTGNEGYTSDGNSEDTTNVQDNIDPLPTSDSLSKAKADKEAQEKASKAKKEAQEKVSKADKEAQAKKGVDNQNHREQ